MATEYATQSGSTSALEKGLGLLERAWEAHWALRLTCITLCFDMAMLLHSRHGLSSWSTGDGTLLVNVGWLAIFLVVFSFAVAVVVPSVLSFLRDLGYALQPHLPPFPTPADERRYRPGPGYVYAGELLDLALEERDEFLYRLYEKHKEDREAWERAQRQTGELTGAALLCALADWVLSRSMPGSAGLIDVIMSRLGGFATLAVIVVLMSAAYAMKRAWFSFDPPNVIYYPPLYREKQRKEQNDRGRH